MMMERAKTAPAPEESTQPNNNNKSSAPSNSTTQQQAPTEERVNDIQRRLNNLDTTTNTATTSSSNKSDVVKSGETLVEQVKQQQSQTGKNNPLLVSCNLELPLYIIYVMGCMNISYTFYCNNIFLHNLSKIILTKKPLYFISLYIPSIRNVSKQHKNEHVSPN